MTERIYIIIIVCMLIFIIQRFKITPKSKGTFTAMVIRLPYPLRHCEVLRSSPRGCTEVTTKAWTASFLAVTAMES